MTDTLAQAAFLAAVTEQTARLAHISGGICPTCAECQSLYGMSAECIAAAQGTGALPDEPHIGRMCGTCGVSCLQDLYDAHAVDGDGALAHLSICGDCLCWCANGHLPRFWEGFTP